MPVPHAQRVARGVRVCTATSGHTEGRGPEMKQEATVESGQGLLCPSCPCKPRLTPRQSPPVSTSLHAARPSRPLGPGDHGPPIGTGEAAPLGVRNLPSAGAG